MLFKTDKVQIKDIIMFQLLLTTFASNRMPLGRMGFSKNLGSPAVFLASDAAAYITGSVLRVDGGLYIKGSQSLIAESQDSY
jgi:enoyl-[acyl-carrier-protein] reductase (NADH)